MANRFYKTVDVKKAEGGYHVTLDGRVLKTPGKRPLVFDRENRAQLVAGEWDKVEKEIRPELMPCTRLMNVACEVTPNNRPDLIKEFRQYTQTDLLCYRATHPEDLAARQHAEWQPVLNWAADTHAIALATTTGLSALAQTPVSLDRATNFADALENVELTLLLHFTSSLGSSILGLAVMVGHLNIETAFETSILDQRFQNERWGTDDEALARTTLIGDELIALSKLI